MILLASVAFAEDPPSATVSAPAPAPIDLSTVRPPIKEIDHPQYQDAAGTLLTWDQVRELSAGTDALARIRERRAGRTLVRLMFAGATALEAWGTYQLALDDHWTKYPLGAQTALTGMCAILSITSAPHDIQADHAIVLDAVNGALRRR